MKVKRILCVLLAGAFMFAINGIAADSTGARADSASGGTLQDGMEEEEPQDSLPPMNTVEPAQTLNPLQTPEPTPKPTPLVKLLRQVTGVKIERYSTKAVKLSWKKHTKAKYYRVYYSKKKTGSYRYAGITRGTHYLVNKLKNNTTYYFYVQACEKKKKSITDSRLSKKVRMKTRTYSRKTVFAGDSITQGVAYCFSQMHIGGTKKTVAYKGLNTVTFHTTRVFNEQTGLQKLISENPYRVYMMLGMNEIYYRPIKYMIAEYRDMIQAIQQACPDTDIILCAISPVSKEEKARRPGFKQLPIFNKKLKKIAKQTGTTYYDYTGFLKDSDGYLKSEYSAGDGTHWNIAAYMEFAKEIEKFEKYLDR